MNDVSWGPKLPIRVCKETQAPVAPGPQRAHFGAIPGRVQPVLGHVVAVLARVSARTRLAATGVDARDRLVEKCARAPSQGALVRVRPRADAPVVRPDHGAKCDLVEIHHEFRVAGPYFTGANLVGAHQDGHKR